MANNITKRYKRGSEKTVFEVALRNLGVSSTEEINAWFRKSYAGGYRIDGMEDAVALFLSRAWRVHCVGDYDGDGVNGESILMRGFAFAIALLKYLEAEHAQEYALEKARIPYRFTEGFGLNKTIIEEIPDGDNTLIVTVDNGIAALDAITLAKERGFHVIVIDHHEPVMADGVPFLPDADVIIDPHAKEGSADYTEYCGAGLAYRFICHLVDRISDGHPEIAKKVKNFKAGLEPFAMIGTIADVVELREENYVIARNGLNKLGRRIAIPGVLALCDRLNITNPTAGDIGFKIGPCLNANGRLYDDGAAKSVALLTCSDYQLAEQLADETVKNNNLRKQQVEDGYALAKRIISSHDYGDDLPLVIYVEGLNEGIIGIIAGRLQEEYGTVACVFTDSSEEGVLKGSGRSTAEVNLKELLDHFGELFVRYGGHAGAAGMSIEAAKLETFRRQANAYAKVKKFTHEVTTELAYDLEIRADQVAEYLNEVLKFGPFGQGNDPVMFKITGFRLNEVAPRSKKAYVGKNGVKLSCDHCQAIGFGMVDRLKASTASALTLYGTLSYNYFKGNATPQIEFVDFEEEPEPEREETPLMKALRAQAVRK